MSHVLVDPTTVAQRLTAAGFGLVEVDVNDDAVGFEPSKSALCDGCRCQQLAFGLPDLEEPDDHFD